MAVARGAEQEQILRGPIPRALVRLAWPVLVSMTLHTFFNIVNAFWVGRLGPAALASVTTSLFATWSLWAVAEMVGVGLVAVVARHAGAGEGERADHAAAQGILLAIGLGLIVAGFAAFIPKHLFALLGTEADVAREGIVFLRTIFAGALAFFLLYTLEGILRAWGDTRTPMRITSLVIGLNIVLDPVLIFGLGPFPRMEVLGAAVATVAAHGLGVLLFLRHFCLHRKRFPGIPRHLLRVDPAVMGRLLRIGAPTSLNTVLFSVVYLFLSREAAGIGTGPLAALGVGNRVESISYLGASALSIAAATVVGQNLGARQPERAVRTARVAAAIGLGICTFWGLCFFVLARPILGIFSDDPSVLVPGVRFLRIVALCQPFMGLEIALAGAYEGAGYTLVPMSISSSISILRIPLAAIVTRRFAVGFDGIAWVISVTCALRGLLMLSLLRAGRWVHTRVGS